MPVPITYTEIIDRDFAHFSAKGDRVSLDDLLDNPDALPGGKLLGQNLAEVLSPAAAETNTSAPVDITVTASVPSTTMVTPL